MSVDPHVSFATGVKFVLHYIRRQRLFGRVPLFVLGGGVSVGTVPLLSDIGGWLNESLVAKEAGLPTDERWLIEHSLALKDNTATRRSAAELFSALQRPITTSQPGTLITHLIWQEFSRSFLVTGFDSGAQHFKGVTDAKPRKAHKLLAELLWQSSAYALSLNFDGLTYRALKDKGDGALALHRESDVNTYFASPQRDYYPAVINVRGDVFYAKCENPSCPSSTEDHPLDRLRPDKDLRCSACSLGTLRLQFSFPGFREKEEVADPILSTTRAFVVDRISAIIVLGLSGKWDRYLLDFLFDLSQERRLPIIDVKPDKPAENRIDAFRYSYYPSVPNFDGHDSGSSYIHLEGTAGSFMQSVVKAFD